MIKEDASIEIYTSRTCGFCYMAKEMLKARGLKYTEYDVTVDDKKRMEMMQRSGRRSVPQIFVDGVSIGGSHELKELLG